MTYSFFKRLLPLTLLAACQPPQPPAQPSVKPASKALVAVYMVGSTLEDDVVPVNGVPDESETGRPNVAGYGSQDLREIVEGLAPDGAADVFVAFGGARQAGWEGVRYADSACLKQDAKDNRFGNDSCYSYVDTKVSMSQPESLKAFLKQAGIQSQGYAKNYLVLWNHGGGFLGYGHDSHAGSSLLSLPQLAQTLKDGNFRPDLLGFDACLMGGLETAQKVQPYADYLLASEALEPAHGWNYTDFLADLSRRGGDASAEETGKKIIDSYITSPAHQSSKRKVLSLYQLSRIPALLSALDAWAQPALMTASSEQIEAVEQSQYYGAQSKSDRVSARDLQDIAERFLKADPSLKTVTERLKQNLAQTVLYTRSDGTKPGSSGMSVFGLDQQLMAYYPQNLAPTDSFWQFAKQYTQQLSSDSSRPVLTRLSPFGVAQTPQTKCATATCYQVEDNLGLKGVYQAFVSQPPGFERLSGGAVSVVVGKQRLEAVEGNYYTLPPWDGQWVKICDGSCEPGQYVFAPAYGFETPEADGSQILSASARLNGQPVQVSIQVSADKQVKDLWATPILPESQVLPLLFSRQQLHLKAGDTLAFDFLVYFHQENRTEWIPGIPISFKNSPRFLFAPLEGKLSRALIAVDAADNFQIEAVSAQ